MTTNRDNKRLGLRYKTHLVQITMQAMPRSCSLALGTEREARYRSTQLTVTCSARLEKSFIVVTSTNQSTNMYLVDEGGNRETHFKLSISYLQLKCNNFFVQGFPWPEVRHLIVSTHPLR